MAKRCAWFLLVCAIGAALMIFLAEPMARTVGRAIDQNLDHYERSAGDVLSANCQLETVVLGHSGQPQRPGGSHSSPRGVAIFSCQGGL